MIEIAYKYLEKGKQVYLQGKIQTRKWEDKDGRDRYTTEVVLGPYNATLQLLGGRDRDGDSGRGRDRGGRDRQEKLPIDRKQQRRREELDDNIPF